jgi:cell filamentation protein
VTFDPFGDFAEKGYLRNFAGSKDRAEISILEADSFSRNIERALQALASQKTLSYANLLDTHRILFGDFYPWAGKDRLEIAPNLAIKKAGLTDLFAYPNELRRAGQYALDQGSSTQIMRAKPGEVMGYLAYAHPFLDGNGRSIMTVHSDLCRRAGIHIDWAKTDKSVYLSALTEELQRPERGHLDAYLKPYVREGTLDITSALNTLQETRGLNGLLAALRDESSTQNAAPRPEKRAIDLGRTSKGGSSGPEI